MRLLDLFCGAGGAAMGYHRAGFTEIVGIDVKPQPRYPFRFIQGDAMRPPVKLEDFDAIHASPPCQSYSHSRHLRARNSKRQTPKLITDVRAMLMASGCPWVIENVEGAREAMSNPATACGTAFGLLVRRHRLFESSECLMMPPCQCGDRTQAIYPSTPRANGERPPSVFVNIHASGTSAELAAQGMGIDWIPSRGFRPTQALREAIPPAYSEFIGRQLIAAILEGRAS